MYKCLYLCMNSINRGVCVYLLYKLQYLYTDCINGGTCVIIIMAWLHTPRL